MPDQHPPTRPRRNPTPPVGSLPIGREVSAGIIIYRLTSEGPKFLLLYNGGDYWNFPKGKLAEGERNFQAALREVWEETGISERNLRFQNWFKVEDRFTYVRDHKRIFKTVTYFLAETNTQEVHIKLLPEEHQGERHDGYGWFPFRYANRFVTSPNLKRHLRSIYENLVHGTRVPRRSPSSAREGNHVPGRSQGYRKPQGGPRRRERPQPQPQQ